MLTFVTSQAMLVWKIHSIYRDPHNVDKYRMVDFSPLYSHTSLKISKMWLGNAKWLMNPSQGDSPFSSWCLQACMIILFMELKISVLFKWSYRSLQSRWLLNLKISDRTWAHCPISFEHVPFWCLFLELCPITHHSGCWCLVKISNRIRACLS